MTAPTCLYLLPPDGHPQRRCEEPATCTQRTRAGYVFPLCQQHADQVLRDAKRFGQTIHLSPIVQY